MEDLKKYVLIFASVRKKESGGEGVQISGQYNQTKMPLREGMGKILGKGRDQLKKFSGGIYKLSFWLDLKIRGEKISERVRGNGWLLLHFV